MEAFPRALKDLAQDRSIRSLANKTGLERSHLHRLLSGQREPDAYSMRVIAYSFQKHPSYFAEWRTLYIAAALMRRLEWNADATIGLYTRFDQQWKNREYDEAT